MTTKRDYYTADQDLLGGSECQHRHRTEAGARGCLPVPPHGGGAFSMARIHHYRADGSEVDDYAEQCEREDAEREEIAALKARLYPEHNLADLEGF